MDRLNCVPWVHHGRDIQGQYEFFCKDRFGRSIRKNKNLIFSLRFNPRLNQETTWLRRLMILNFLQDNDQAMAVYCDKDNNIWMSQMLYNDCSQEMWNGQILWQLSSMDFFETQLSVQRTPHRRIDRGVYDLLG